MGTRLVSSGGASVAMTTMTGTAKGFPDSASWLDVVLVMKALGERYGACARLSTPGA
jgi:hypothetical protein